MRKEANDETIRLACWDCCAVYASPKHDPRCPNCGWRPQELVLTSDGVWANPDTVVIGRKVSPDDGLPRWVRP
jgi:hypothetical protein